MRFSSRIFLMCLTLFFISCRSKKNASSTPITKTNVSENKQNEENKLQSFIVDWQGVVYKYGGNDKSGIDCSHFTEKLYADVYHKTLTGNSAALEQATINVPLEKMQEGDLVFFKIESNKVSHVGVYIGNNKFVHASTKKGVMVNDLNEPYYKKYFFKAGRIK